MAIYHYKGGCVDTAKHFDTSPQQVSRIRHGLTWKKQIIIESKKVKRFDKNEPVKNIAYHIYMDTEKNDRALFRNIDTQQFVTTLSIGIEYELHNAESNFELIAVYDDMVKLNYIEDDLMMFSA